MNSQNRCFRGKTRHSYFARARGVLLAALAAAGLLWAGSRVAAAADWYVTTNGTGSGGASWANATNDIQAAIDLSGEGDTVWVSNGVYCITDQIVISNNITLKGLNGDTNTLVYADYPDYTTRCFSVSGGGVLDGFTVSNGHCIVESNNWEGGGGALLNTGTIQNCYFVQNVCSNGGKYAGGGAIFVRTSGTISNCVIFTNIVYIGSFPNANQYAGGGGIFLCSNACVVNCRVISNYSNGNGGGIVMPLTKTDISDLVLVSNCFVEGNVGYTAGGIHCGVSGLLESRIVTDCIISNNNASGSEGGGLYLLCGALVKNCTIVNNGAYDFGGGVSVSGYNRFPTIISNCLISGNRRGGLLSAGATTIVERCIISWNTNAYKWQAGGVYVSGGSIYLRNCLIHNNIKGGIGGAGGVYITNSAKFLGDAGIYNCTIVSNNHTEENCGGLGMSGHSNYVVNCIIADNFTPSNEYPNIRFYYNEEFNRSNVYSSCFVTTDAYYLAESQGNTTNDPAFKDAANGNWRLTPHSPCLNTGTNHAYVNDSVDLDGMPRRRYGRVDMGCYELLLKGSVFLFR